MWVEDFILKVRRAESPLYARLKRMARYVLTFNPSMPRALDRLFLFVSYLFRLRYEVDQRIAVALFRYPLLRARCAQVGKRLLMEVVPEFNGPIRVYLGDDVNLSGHLNFTGARIFPAPELRIGDRTFIGSGTQFLVAKSITVGSDVLIGSGCWMLDYSAHPLNPDLRLAGAQVSPDEVRPVRIENKVWLGKNVIVLPGVTIGEGAVVGAATVVTKDVPPGGICVGNPGRLLPRTVYEQGAKSQDREQR